MDAYSVIIPLYNKEKYVRRAIESVLAQTCQDFDEIIVVNDGSTDGSVEVVQSIKDPRIRLIHQENRGWPAAKNHAVRLAKREMTAHLDADDEWKPDFLSIITGLIDRYPGCGAYSTAYRVAIKDGPVADISDMDRTGIPPGQWEGVIPNYFRASLGGYSALCNSAIVIPRRTFEAAGPFQEHETLGADLEMWCRIALRFRLGFSTRIGAIYHKDAANRVCDTNRFIKGYILETLNAGLAGTSLPDGVTTKDVESTHFQWVTGLATQCIERGRPGPEIRRVLRQATRSRRYHAKLIALYLLSSLPLASMRSEMLRFLRMVSRHPRMPSGNAA
jgi:glycosyltransferase involved in cell wall biosynthesis